MGFIGGREPRTGRPELALGDPQKLAEQVIGLGLAASRKHLMAVAKMIDTAPERDGDAHIACLTLVAGLDDLAERFRERPVDAPDLQP